MGYARILKDNNGKPSGYRECDGEVAFMPEQQSYENIFRRVKIDLATMEVVNHDFIKDKERALHRRAFTSSIRPILETIRSFILHMAMPRLHIRKPLKYWMMVLECMALKVMAEMQNLCTFLLILRKPATLSD